MSRTMEVMMLDELNLGALGKYHSDLCDALTFVTLVLKGYRWGGDTRKGTPFLLRRERIREAKAQIRYYRARIRAVELLMAFYE